jgi:hypothetical protein
MLISSTAGLAQSFVHVKADLPNSTSVNFAKAAVTAAAGGTYS